MLEAHKALGMSLNLHHDKTAACSVAKAAVKAPQDEGVEDELYSVSGTSYCLD